MDFLDPLARRTHLQRLYVGYVLVAIAIVLAASVLLMISYGFSISKDGEVIQNGLVFVSSKPTPADVYLDGIKKSKPTNTRYNLPEGQYDLQLKRDGYRAWQRKVSVRGGQVQRFDYPFLFPESLNSSTLKTYPGAAGADTLVTTTPDNRWLFIQQKAGAASFDVYDLKAPTKDPLTFTIPASAYAAGGEQDWEVVSWADDKVHVLLKHYYGKSSFEYLLIDRGDATQTVNLSAAFGESPSKLQFINSKYDRYYLYDEAAQTLQKATLNQPEPVAFLANVMTYDTYQNDTVLYVTPSTKDTTEVELRLLEGQETNVIRTFPSGTTYHVAVADYSRSLFVAATAEKSNVVYIYKNPVSQINNANIGVAVPAGVLKISKPNFLSFSAGGRFVVAEHGTDFATYDNEYKRQYVYHKNPPLDAGQSHATWMDGARLQYVSNGDLYVFDYDGINMVSLVPSLQADMIFYDPTYSHVFTFVKTPGGASGDVSLTSTWLLTPSDQ